MISDIIKYKDSSMKDEKYGVGKIFKTTEGYEIEIIEKLKGDYRIIEFKDKMKHKVKTDYKAIKRGNIKNPYHPSVCGIGCFGVGEYKATIEEKDTEQYKVWASMIHRCYDERYHKRQPTYIGTTVCEEWLNYQIFAKWYDENLPKIEGIKFELDKDLLQQGIESKVYSPETCLFLPKRINIFLINKLSSNTSGYIGVSLNSKKSWIVRTRSFDANIPIYVGSFKDVNEASKAYQKARTEQAEKAKQYLRDLNYLPEEIIQLVK